MEKGEGVKERRKRGGTRKGGWRLWREKSQRTPLCVKTNVYGKQNNALPPPFQNDIQALILRTYEYVKLHVKGELRWQTELSYEDMILDYPSGPNIIISVLK